VTDTAAAPYRVLARKYRPANFAELIGQEAMVRTLSNAIAAGRLAQAYMLTGVRGVGKTTTARVIARALNCIGPAGANAGPTVEVCGICEHCTAIAESRHVDVIEMDAASRTGVNDIRDLIDGVNYRPLKARFKVYIVDEVHMLSTAAFNALLKTLEEPPEHVKFVFATTEIRKVPVTVLSRCQRFDLKRVEAARLIAHFARVCEQEGVSADDEALALIARAAEGSVRDGLSLLDQAIAHVGAHGGNRVEAAAVRDMLGLADRARVFDLYDAAMRGDAAGALALLREQYDAGADPAVVLTDMLELTHLLTRLKLTPDAANDASLPETERTRGRDMAATLGMPVLTRAWQMLLKGLGEARLAPAPLTAAEMVIVRLAYVADLPTPGDLAKSLRDGTPAAAPSGARGARPAPSRPSGPAALALAESPPAAAVLPAPAPAAAPVAATVPVDFPAAVAQFAVNREAILHTQLCDHARLVRYEIGRIDLALVGNPPRDMLQKVAQRLELWTGRPWIVTQSPAPGTPTLNEQAKAADEARGEAARSHPLIAKLLSAFPGAELGRVRELGEADPAAVAGPAAEPETFPDAPPEED
jgi:DNA polymerase-3 subunit gamma/tau